MRWLMLLVVCWPAVGARAYGLEDGCMQPEDQHGLTSLIIAMGPDVIAGSGLLAGDQLMVVWEDDAGALWCAGDNVYSGAGGLAVTGWLEDPFVADPRQLPVVGEAVLMVRRGDQFFDTTAIDGDGVEQPFPYAGKTLVFLAEFSVQVVVVGVEDPPRSLPPYPNPTAGTITIRLPRPARTLVYDALGRIVLESAGSRMDLSGLPPGVYALRVDGRTHMITLLR